MLPDHVDGGTAHPVANRPPGRPQVLGHEDVRRVVVVPVTVEADVRALRLMVRGLHPAHVIGDGRAAPRVHDLLRDIRPRLAPVAADLYGAVVRAGPQDARGDRRFGNGRDFAIARRAIVLRERRGVREDPHDRQAVLVESPGEVLGDAPALAPVVGDEEAVAAQVDAVRVMRGHEDRGLPVESVTRRRCRAGRA